jgi:outer membrane protein OmpA-like peptidoglycan-associated protein
MKNLLFTAFLIILSVSFCPSLKAQIWLSNDDIYKQAEEFLNAEDYEEALPLYLLLEKKDYKSANVFYKIGLCYLNTRGKKEKAIPYLEVAIKNASSVYNNTLQETKAPLKALLMLGVAYRINNEPDKAIEIFEILKDSIDISNTEMQTIIDLHIKRCENAIVLKSFSGKATKERLPDIINDDYPNYNPVLTNHETLLYYMEGLKFYDAIMRSRFVDGQWQAPQNITPDLGCDGDYYLVGASADGSKLLLNFYETLKAGEIFMVEKNEKGWSPLKRLNDNINTKYDEKHASLSSDGKTLYFTSNRPGGFGGQDIYLSKLGENNDWGQAVNLGPAINTPYNEESPFISYSDSILYFSSQGHLNIGGYDVFYSVRKNDGEWNQPINMGSPVSTADDDLFYFPMENGLHGLMSRLEDSSNTYDIYRYQYISFPNTPRYRLRGNVNDSSSLGYDNYMVLVTDLNTLDTIQKVHPDNKGYYSLLLPDGKFSVLLSKDSKIVSKADISLNNEFSETIEIPKEKFIPEILLAQTTTQTKPLQAEYSDTLILQDILFAFNNFSVQTKYIDYLSDVTALLSKQPSFHIQIIGYADAVGSEDYNLKLSEKRAQSVARYLTNLKVDTNQIEIIGKGESDPVAINENPDGTDNPEGRKYNRRVVIVPVNLSSKVIVLKKTIIPGELRQKEE